MPAERCTALELRERVRVACHVPVQPTATVAAPPPPPEWVKQCLRDSTLLNNHTIYANDYASFELPSSDTTPCAQACCEDSRCFGWSVDDPIP